MSGARLVLVLRVHGVRMAVGALDADEEPERAVGVVGAVLVAPRDGGAGVELEVVAEEREEAPLEERGDLEQQQPVDQLVLVGVLDGEEDEQPRDGRDAERLGVSADPCSRSPRLHRSAGVPRRCTKGVWR